MAFRKFLVRLPSGDRYWTVIDSSYRPVSDVDEWLLHLRVGRDCAESTTEAYATSMALFLVWCQSIGRDWRSTPPEFGRFLLWLRYYEPGAAAGAVRRVVRGERRINAVTVVVREFFKHAAAIGLIDAGVLDPFYEWVRDYDLPVDARGERGSARLRRRPRHRLREPEHVADAASDEEVLALLRACRNARDVFIVLVLWRAGNRRGELTGVRMEDVHFLPDSAALGCLIKGPHLHVLRRPNSNGATAKSRRSRAIPVDWFVVQAFDNYMLLRNGCPEARRCDFLLVNLFRGPIGQPMRPRALNELLTVLSRRAGLGRMIHPHMLRHGFGTNLSTSGSTLAEIKELLGHAFLSSSQIYLHPPQDLLREAVERVGTPRVSRAGTRR